MTTNTATANRLNDIADRNARSRVIDIVFAALVAMLIVLSVASLGEAAASPMTHSALTADGGVCELAISAVC
jgi:hypothetical protein